MDPPALRRERLRTASSRSGLGQRYHQTLGNGTLTIYTLGGREQEEGSRQGRCPDTGYQLEERSRIWMLISARIHCQLFWAHISWAPNVTVSSKSSREIDRRHTHETMFQYIYSRGQSA